MLKTSRRALQVYSCVLMLSIVAFQGNTEELDDKILNMTDDPIALKQGGTLYQQSCTSCHARDLSGATGFNLKDGEWIHGNKPSEILDNIKTGFMKAGMPGFGSVYSEHQLQSVVAFILSKREGFDDLSYKIYQMNDTSDRKATPEKLIKSGKLSSNIADFNLPEIQNYSIEFEGDFYTRQNEDTKIWVQWGKPIELEVEVNGKDVERIGQWSPVWKLARGKQHLKVVYYSGTNKPNQRNVSLIVGNADMSIKLFPISERAKQVLSDIKVEVIATNKTRIQRKKIHKIPAYSISVGLPSKMNYAFNTRTCSIVGIWEGELLNVGPNVNGRGQDGSLPLGTRLIEYPQSLQHEQLEGIKCQYQGYRMVNQEPVFSYRINDSEYQLLASSKYQGDLSFHYRTKNPSQLELSVSLPTLKNFSWLINAKTTDDSQAVVSADESGNFTISVKKNI